MSTARINEKFLAGVRDSRAVEVVAVGSRTREPAEHYAREHGIDRAHGSYDGLHGDPWHCLDPVIELRREGGVERIEIERVNFYRLEAANLSAAIRGEGPLRLGREDALGQSRCIEALYEAADPGVTATLG